MVAILSIAAFALSLTQILAQKNKYTATPSKDVAKAAATALTLSPVTHVKGKAFDRIAFIWLENTDYPLAAADPQLAALAKDGITLTQMYAVTHPSEPNYVASHGGDYFGMDNDDFNQIPSNVSTVIDLLESKGISWAEYQEDMPYSGFEGYQYLNQKTGANDYVRKHNPAVIYNSCANRPERLAKMKNLTMFYKDLEENKLPQWMFITPNMTSDGHDSSITVAGNFIANFLTPLLSNKNFMQNTVVLVTFDENESYPKQNQIFSFLIGDAIPKNLIGTIDNSYYNHYSQISTVSANWGLDTLGRFDVGANVFKFVADKTGDVIRSWKTPAFSSMFFNQSYPGPFSDSHRTTTLPVPNTNANYAGRSVLPKVVQKWSHLVKDTYYSTNVEIPDGAHPPAAVS